MYTCIYACMHACMHTCIHTYIYFSHIFDGLRQLFLKMKLQLKNNVKHIFVLYTLFNLFYQHLRFFCVFPSTIIHMLPQNQTQVMEHLHMKQSLRH